MEIILLLLIAWFVLRAQWDGVRWLMGHRD